MSAPTVANWGATLGRTFRLNAVRLPIAILIAIVATVGCGSDSRFVLEITNDRTSWQTYEDPFSSLSACEARMKEVLDQKERDAQATEANVERTPSSIFYLYQGRSPILVKFMCKRVA